MLAGELIQVLTCLLFFCFFLRKRGVTNAMRVTNALCCSERNEPTVPAHSMKLRFGRWFSSTFWATREERPIDTMQAEEPLPPFLPLSDGQLAAADELFAAGQRGLTDRIADCLSRLFEQEDRRGGGAPEAEGGAPEAEVGDRGGGGGAPAAEVGDQEVGDQRVPSVSSAAIVACWNDRGSFLTALWDNLCRLAGTSCAERAFRCYNDYEPAPNLLHHAASFGSTGAIQALLGLRRPEGNIRVLGVNEEDAVSDKTALGLAAFRRHIGATRLLLRCKAGVDGNREYRESPLQSAIIYGDGRMVRLLLDSKATVNSTTFNSTIGYTPLYFAAQRDRGHIIRALIDARADVHAASGSLSNTPLHEAVACGHARAVSAILCARGDTGKCNRFGVTPLIMAADRVRKFADGHRKNPLRVLELLEANSY